MTPVAEVLSHVLVWSTPRYLGAMAKCESPIEEILLEALCRDLHYVPVSAIFCDEVFARLYRGLDGQAGAFVFPQHWIGRFRVDFLIVAIAMHLPPVLLIVECDGRQFHTSPEQITRDASRDQHFSSIGYIVRRFTGAQIRQDINRVLSDSVAALGEVGEEICWATGRYPRPGKQVEHPYTDRELIEMGLGLI